jgi:hypothetical protein
MTMSLTEVQDKIQKGEYRVSDHATKRMIQRSIERYEAIEAIFNGDQNDKCDASRVARQR